MNLSPMQAVSRALHYRFADPDLLRLALTHRSLEADSTDTFASNERLEFLGDAVLGLVVATELHDAWDLPEGQMAKVRAAVVNETTLAAVARTVGIPEALRLGKGEESTGGRHKASIVADAMEAVIGAIFLDGGFESAREVVLERWRPLIADRAAAPGGRDYKTRLQELLARRGEEPVYEIVDEGGPDHARYFETVVRVGGEVVGRGTGTSKKRTEQAAARDALVHLGDTDA